MKPKVKYLGISESDTKRFEVTKGKGYLQKVLIQSRSPKIDDYKYNFEWRYKGIPLVHINEVGYGTSESMIMHGHDSKLKQTYYNTLSKISSFSNVETLIKPYLEIMDSGFYTVYEVSVNPSNGLGGLFWDIDNSYHSSKLTSIEMRTVNYPEYVFPHHDFLFPSEFSYRYNEERVQYYIDFYYEKGYLPYLILANLMSSLNVILDGHHRACAAARLGIYPKSIVISGPSTINPLNLKQKYRMVEDEEIPFSSRPLNEKDWAKDYDLSLYPTYLEEQLSKLYSDVNLNELFEDDIGNNHIFNKYLYLIINAHRNKREGTDIKIIKLLSRQGIDASIEVLLVEMLITYKNELVEEYIANRVIDQHMHKNVKEALLRYWE